MGVRSNIDTVTLRAALAHQAADVAVALLGEPNRHLSSKREQRFGRKGSLAVVIEGARAGIWFDHENGEGRDPSSRHPTVVAVNAPAHDCFGGPSGDSVSKAVVAEALGTRCEHGVSLSVP
jgi:hypothetical protein